MFDEMSYWKDGYRKLYKEYRSLLSLIEYDKKRIGIMENSIDALVYEKMILDLEIERLERQLLIAVEEKKL